MEKKKRKFTYQQFFKGYTKGEEEDFEQKLFANEESLSLYPYHVLKVLGKKMKAVTLLELSAKIGVDIVTTQMIIRKMEKEGLIETNADKKTGNDTVQLTAKGKIQLKEL
jgi:DNA-binding MarR family transcriptional regulator